jgi:hypothetical protein
MHSQTPLKTLRSVALSLVTMAACAASVAAEPVLLAKANVAATSQLLRVNAPAAASFPERAEAEMMGMGYGNFDALLAEALGTPTAAGFSAPASRGAVEAVIARTMAGLMP